MESFRLKNKDSVDFRYFQKSRHFENILFELGAVGYQFSFWEIRKFLMNGLRESVCFYSM
jgi:hypothetical protein